MTEPYTAMAGAGGKDRVGRERIARSFVWTPARVTGQVRRCFESTSHSGRSLAHPPGFLPLGPRFPLATMPDGVFRFRVRSPR